MKRVLALTGLVLSVVLCARAMHLFADEEEPEEKPRPKIPIADLNDNKKMGTWVYVAVANDRKVGRLTINVTKEESEPPRPHLQEIEERACVFGKMKSTRDYDLTRGLEFPILTSNLDSKLGAYHYQSDFTLGADTVSGTKGHARISTGKLVDYDFMCPPLDSKDPAINEAEHKNPFYSMGIVRLLPRLISDLPTYPRTIIVADYYEPRAKITFIGASLAADSDTEEVSVLGKTLKCQVVALKNGPEVIGKYWLDPKWQIVKFTEKLFIHGNTMQTTYTLATPADGEAALDEAAKWGAGAKDPESAALAWLKEVLKGDADAAAKLTDQAAVDAVIAAIAPPGPDNAPAPPQDVARQAKIKAASALPVLTKMFKDSPSEILLRYVYVVREDPKGGVNVYLPTTEGNCVVHMTKGSDPAAPDTWKVSAILPPL